MVALEAAIFHVRAILDVLSTWTAQRNSLVDRPFVITTVRRTVIVDMRFPIFVRENDAITPTVEGPGTILDMRAGSEAIAHLVSPPTLQDSTEETTTQDKGPYTCNTSKHVAATIKEKGPRNGPQRGDTG